MTKQFQIFPSFYLYPYFNFPSIHFPQDNFFLQNNAQMASDTLDQKSVKIQEIVEHKGQNESMGLKCEKSVGSSDKKSVAEQQYEKERDRNIISNSMKVFRKFLKDCSETRNSPLQRIIEQRGLKYSTEEFLSDLNVFIPAQKNYYGTKFVKSLVSQGKTSKNFQIVIRILLNYFFKKLVFPTALTSTKILKDCRKRQLIGARKILSFCKF